MKRILTFLVALALPLSLLGQTLTPEDYVRRYNNLTDRVGAAGVGVETLLDKWAADYPDDLQQLLARFSFCFTKAQTTNVIQLAQDRYLGREPLIPMTDSLGRKANFFEDTVYDDEQFGLALEAMDRAIALNPEKLDLRMLRADALIAYEKGSPDMSLASLKALVDEHFTKHPAWTHESLEKVDDEVFKALMQDYCFAFFRLGTDSSAEEVLRPGAQEASVRHHRHPQQPPPRPHDEGRKTGEEIPRDDGSVRRIRGGPHVRQGETGRFEPEKIDSFASLGMTL